MTTLTPTASDGARGVTSHDATGDGPDAGDGALALPLALAIERGIELVLRLDPGTRARLAKLDGRVLRIELSRPELVLVLIVADARVSVPVRHDGEADLVLAGSLAALRSLGTSSDAIHRGEVTIRGDLGVASALREVIGGFDIDPVEIVSPLLGDTLAHKLGRALRGSGSWLRRSRGAFGENAREYLEEEAELVATRPEVERFCTEVDAIARAGDRLASRLARLERAVQGAVEGTGTPDRDAS